ncbi:hypothetical protein [Leptolyngbya phage Lbo240-yong1]|uniref:Uncharacterized protein n=1 Tax=Leptolyngbya phage Lbo240-yong1 TaxID=2928836 RepID=A0A9X9E327_9CAUD|nr:hypothetical protein [Leptolyngbya phage Lbo240-yong1]
MVTRVLGEPERNPPLQFIERKGRTIALYYGKPIGATYEQREKLIEWRNRVAAVVRQYNAQVNPDA